MTSCVFCDIVADPHRAVTLADSLIAALSSWWRDRGER